MAEIYLELTPAATAALPPIRWINGSAPELPVDYSKQTEKAGMLSGSQRFHIKSMHPRRWTLTWDMLTVAELAAMITLNELNRELHFQNNWEDMAWRHVVITGFEYNVIVGLGPTGCRYGLTMTLAEVL